MIHPAANSTAAACASDQVGCADAEASSFWMRLLAADHHHRGRRFLVSGLLWTTAGLALVLMVVANWPAPWSVWGSDIQAGRQTLEVSPAWPALFRILSFSQVIFFGAVPLLWGVVGNSLVPCQIGAREMALPRLNAFAYWCLWPAYLLIVAAFFAPGSTGDPGWTATPPLIVSGLSIGVPCAAQLLWLVGTAWLALALLAGSVNLLATMAMRRKDAVTWSQLPMTAWATLLTSGGFLLAAPIWLAAAGWQVGGLLSAAPRFEFSAASIFDLTAAEGGNPDWMWQQPVWAFPLAIAGMLAVQAVGWLLDAWRQLVPTTRLAGTWGVVVLCAAAALNAVVVAVQLSGRTTQLWLALIVVFLIVTSVTAIAVNFPRMFDRRLNMPLAVTHVTTTALFAVAALILWGLQAALPEPASTHDLWMNQHVACAPLSGQLLFICCAGIVAAQVLFVVNCIFSLYWGRRG